MDTLGGEFEVACYVADGFASRVALANLLITLFAIKGFCGSSASEDAHTIVHGAVYAAKYRTSPLSPVGVINNKILTISPPT